jgi:beta-glucosidase
VTVDTPFENAVSRLRAGGDLQTETNLLSEMLTADEKLQLLDGDAEFWQGFDEMRQAYNARPIVMGCIPRVGIPGLRFSDGPRGVVMGSSTAFPVSIARGATWDPQLEERVGRAIGAEMRAQGANLFGGVCINLPRHPAWGRIQETYGEDPVLLGEMGAALIRGVKRHAMAMVKHYAVNSIENTRYRLNVVVDEAALREVYLPHFRRAVEAGADGVMTAYNAVNGEWAGQNTRLLEGVLRSDWDFSGITVSDFLFGIRDAARSLSAGLDVEAPFRQQRARYLRADLEEGRAEWADVDRASSRIIRTQLRFHAGDVDPEPGADVVFSAEHRALSAETARLAAVLLKNDPVAGRPVLPLEASQLRRIAVIGRLAGVANLGDEGSSAVRPPDVVPILDGIRDALPGVEVAFVPTDDSQAAADAAANADVAILVVGYTAEDEGEYLDPSSMNTPELLALFPPGGSGPVTEIGAEDGTFLMGGAAGGDRVSLRVRPSDAALIAAAAAANERTVVVLVTAGAVITEEWRDRVPAILIGWYNGSEGGRALADVLLGETDAAGRLPYSIPTSEGDLPPFDRAATEVRYDRWHGQRLLDREGKAAAFPLGFGLSYTTFEMGEPILGPLESESFVATVRVTNTGPRRGRHVVQIYGHMPEVVDFPRRVLLGFLPVWLEPGQTMEVAVSASLRPLQRWTGEGFVAASPHVLVEAAGYSGDPAAKSAPLAL